jgi:hypothetical protein
MTGRCSACETCLLYQYRTPYPPVHRLPEDTLIHVEQMEKMINIVHLTSLTVVVATAIVTLLDRDDKVHWYRTLLDSGSEATLIT